MAPGDLLLDEGLTRGQRLAAIAGLSVLFILIFAGANKFGTLFLHLDPLASRDLFWWSLLFVLLAHVRLVERRGLDSIGFRAPRVTTLIFGVAAALALLFVVDPVASWLVQYLNLPTAHGNAAALTYARTPYWYHWLLVTRAAFAEEIVFRGYIIERIELVTASRLLAAAASLVTFCFAHLAFFGWTPLVGIALASIVFIALYQWRRDLWANILAHWLVDASSLIL